VPADDHKQSWKSRRGGTVARGRARRDPVDELATEIGTRIAATNTDAEIDLREGTTEPANGGTRVPLGTVLVDRGAVDADAIDRALTDQIATGRRLGEILIEEGKLDESALTEALAAQLGLGTVDLSRVKLEREFIDLLSADQARELCAIGVRRDGERIVFAVGDPAREGLKPALIAQVNAPVRLVVAPMSVMLDTIARSYLDTGEIGDALRDFEERFGERQPVRIQQQVAVDEHAPVVRVVNLIFESAVGARASDIHIEPQETRVRVRLRTDGALHEAMSLPASMAIPLVSRIKVMADMNIVERRRPQDGQLEVNVLDRDLDVRVSTTSTVFGEKCVMRLLDKTRAVLSLTDLGMAPDTLQTYEKLIRSPYGMVICAGPTGSGKTTTLYATLTAIEDDEINVMTVEDPVEYVFPDINQIRINEQAGVTFAAGLRSILRQDPDAILVGEIRDVDTARVAVQAALTGHFVMSSLHATDATAALHRFMDMGIEPFLVASSLLGVVGQRLLRKICTECIEEYTPSIDELAFFERSGGSQEKRTFKHGAGCSRCGYSGYYERIGVYEVLPVTDAMKELIVVNASLAELRAAAAKEAMRTLRQEAIALVERDITTIAEVFRTVYEL
jgi:type IV pilus assembly protein PilB